MPTGQYDIWSSSYPDDMAWAVLRPLATQQSLTQALGALGPEFGVSVRFLGEREIDGEMCFVREVELHLNGTAVVRARSVCAPQSQWRQILDCGTLPLGRILFGGELRLRRSELLFACVEDDKLARRSWFELENGERLYLSEVFLPAVLAFL